jgi:hypothetical protein
MSGICAYCQDPDCEDATCGDTIPMDREQEPKRSCLHPFLWTICAGVGSWALVGLGYWWLK